MCDPMCDPKPAPAARPATHQVHHVSPGQRDGLRFDEATRRIRELAEAQHGVVSRRQLSELGLGKGLVDDRLGSGHLIALHRGVFALGHSRLSKRGRWMAAVLACGNRAVLSHDSAAELWDLRRGRGITISRLSGGATHAGICVRQVRRLALEDQTVETGIPVTTVERTLLDIAGGLDEQQLERALVAAARSSRLRWPELERVLAEGARRPGIGRLRRVAEAVDPRAVEARSPLEIDFLALCRYFDFPVPQVNVLVAGLLVDFLWPDERVIVETDGYAYHENRAAFEADHERTAQLQAAGYTVHRATWRMLDRNPERFMRLVGRTLGEAITFAM
jgi:hypothetical protein